MKRYLTQFEIHIIEVLMDPGEEWSERRLCFYYSSRMNNVVTRGDIQRFDAPARNREPQIALFDLKYPRASESVVRVDLRHPPHLNLRDLGRLNLCVDTMTFMGAPFRYAGFLLQDFEISAVAEQDHSNIKVFRVRSGSI